MAGLNMIIIIISYAHSFVLFDTNYVMFSKNTLKSESTWEKTLFSHKNAYILLRRKVSLTIMLMLMLI
jgi:hypothetical protein